MIIYFFGFSAWTKVGDFTKTNITGTAATKETETDSEPVEGILKNYHNINVEHLSHTYFFYKTRKKIPTEYFIFL